MNSLAKTSILLLTLCALAFSQSLAPTFTVTPSVDLHPVFMVAGLPGGAGSYQIDLWECAATASAQRFTIYLLAKLGITAKVSYDYPGGAPSFGSPFYLETSVPYIDFSGAANGLINGNEAHQNAGQLFRLYYFYPESTADQLIQEWFGVK